MAECKGTPSPESLRAGDGIFPASFSERLEARAMHVDGLVVVHPQERFPLHCLLGSNTPVSSSYIVTGRRATLI